MTERQKQDKIISLLKILKNLDDGEVILKDLAEELGLSIRTLQRYMLNIEAADFPVYNPQPGVYKFIEGFALSKIKLSLNEAGLLVLFGDFINDVRNKDLSQSLKSLRQKLLASKADNPFYIKLPDIAAYPANQDADALQKAVSGKFQINFKYAVTSSHKDIKPYKLVQYGGFWYLLAVMGKEKILKFRIDEIRNVEITKKTFTPNSKVIKALKESVNIFFELKPDADIKLLVQKEAAKYFKNKKYVPYQKIEKENSDGSLIVASKISKIQEIEPAIFNFMPFVKIVSPEKLSSILKTKISNYLSQI